jgi:hypothetical protein
MSIGVIVGVRQSKGRCLPNKECNIGKISAPLVISASPLDLQAMFLKKEAVD